MDYSTPFLLINLVCYHAGWNGSDLLSQLQALIALLLHQILYKQENMQHDFEEFQTLSAATCFDAVDNENIKRLLHSPAMLCASERECITGKAIERPTVCMLTCMAYCLVKRGQFGLLLLHSGAIQGSVIHRHQLAVQQRHVCHCCYGTRP